MRVNTIFSAPLRWCALAATMLLLAAACANGDPPTLTIRNETDCILRFRFDNGVMRGAVNPQSSVEYTDARIEEYSYLKAESTMAIFRTFDMAAIREAGWTVTVRPAVEDGACVDVPAG